MGLVKTTVTTLALASVALLASHRKQLELIEEEARASMGNSPTGNVLHDIHAVHSAVRSRIHNYGGTYEFIAGDFAVRNGEARCGGIAACACIEGAERGFTTTMEFEMKGLKCHYYALLERGGEKFRFELRVPPRQIKMPDASSHKGMEYLAAGRK